MHALKGLLLIYCDVTEGTLLCGFVADVGERCRCYSDEGELLLLDGTSCTSEYSVFTNYNRNLQYV